MLLSIYWRIVPEIATKSFTFSHPKQSVQIWTQPSQNCYTCRFHPYNDKGLGISINQLQLPLLTAEIWYNRDSNNSIPPMLEQLHRILLPQSKLITVPSQQKGRCMNRNSSDTYSGLKHQIRNRLNQYLSVWHHQPCASSLHPGA